MGIYNFEFVFENVYSLDTGTVKLIVANPNLEKELSAREKGELKTEQELPLPDPVEPPSSDNKG